MRILIVEDDQNLAQTLKEVVESKGFDTMVCYTCEQAYHEIEKAFDCYLLDLRLPDGSGLDICRRIREFSQDPILFISSDTTETSILESYACYADDYIEKPFRLNVLLAKINSLLQRSGKYKKSYQIEDSVLNLDGASLQIHNRVYSLSLTEARLLEGMFQSYPNYVSRDDCCRLIFAATSHYPSAETLSVRISELRRKLGDDAKYIESVRRLGLRWKV